MAIIFSCPNCERGIKTSDAASGRTGMCPRCQVAVVVPALITRLEAPASTFVPCGSGASTAKPWIATTPFRVTAGIALLALISTAVYWMVWHDGAPDYTPGNSPAALRELAAELPDDVFFVAAGTLSDQKALLLVEMNGLLDRNPALKSEIEQKSEKCRLAKRDLLGFDPDDNKAWFDAGINLDKPIAFFMTSTALPLEDMAANAVLALFPSNAGKAENTIRRLWENSTDSQLKEAFDHNFVLPQPRLLAAVHSGPRLFVKHRTSADSEQQLRVLLESAKAHPLSANTNFIACLEKLPERSDFTFFANIAGIFSTLPKDRMPEGISDILALGVAQSFEEHSAFLLLREHEILDQLRPGGECREFMARFDPPVAAVSWSIADPGELRRVFERMLAGPGGATKSEAAIASDAEIDHLLKNTCGGALFYPDDSKLFFPFNYAVFVKLNDVEAYEAIRRNNRPADQKLVKREFGQNVLCIDESGAVRAKIGDYLVFGTAAAEIEALAKESAAGWQPVIGGKTLLEIQIPIAAAFRKILRDEPDTQKIIKQRIPESLNFTARLEGRSNGLYYHGQYRGVTSAIINFAAAKMAATESARGK
jgi:hypothetical protein